MTPRERAAEIVDSFEVIAKYDYYAAVISAIEQAIIAANEQEREECAKTAEKARGYNRREIASAIRRMRPTRSTSSDNGGTK